MSAVTDEHDHDERVPFLPWENVRTTDPETSRAAADSLRDVSEAQRHVRDIHRECDERYGHGLTDEEQLREYRARYGADTPESSPRKRRHDLMRAGIIVDSGLRRPLASGRAGIVWRLSTADERREREKGTAA